MLLGVSDYGTSLDVAWWDGGGSGSAQRLRSNKRALSDVDVNANDPLDPNAYAADSEDDGLSDAASETEGGDGQKGDKPGSSAVPSWKDAKTLAELAQMMRVAVETQVAKAQAQNVTPQNKVRGDGALRIAFLVLLPPETQRTVLLSALSLPSVWPRVRPIFGAPPYSFLLPGDAEQLAATGFARSRVHMSFDSVRAASSYLEFGHGHFVDEHRRQYKVLRLGHVEPKLTDPPLWSARLSSGMSVVMQMRLPKLPSRSAAMHGRSRSASLFPPPGTRVVLHPSERMASLLRDAKVGLLSERSEIEIEVRRLALRSKRCSTAGLMVSVVHVNYV